MSHLRRQNLQRFLFNSDSFEGQSVSSDWEILGWGRIGGKEITNGGYSQGMKHRSSSEEVVVDSP